MVAVIGPPPAATERNRKIQIDPFISIGHRQHGITEV